MKYILFVFLLSGIIFYSCNSDNAVESNTETSAYVKLLTAESGNTKFELWSATGSVLAYGYNEIGFKVFINGTEKTDGFVKYKPVMYHFIGQTGHSCPVSSAFYYNSSKKLFTGYACFSMISDSASNGQWTGYYNYNNASFVDSIPFTVLYSDNQLIEWDDIVGSNTYVLTLLKPKTPRLGINTFEVLFHKYIGNNLYAEIDSAVMSIKPWMPAHGHGSSSNVNPISFGSGRYEGKVNFNMQGEWYVYDTIKINNTIVTKNDPPRFIFNAQ
ncbi:MAG: FixH family protein [Ignavibacteriae bacterium]|nr:FixH family protein [Ignavibacteriota bacterium]